MIQLNRLIGMLIRRKVKSIAIGFFLKATIDKKTEIIPEHNPTLVANKQNDVVSTEFLDWSFEHIFYVNKIFSWLVGVYHFI